MAQASIASYFNTRKRPAQDEIVSTKNKQNVESKALFIKNVDNVSEKSNDATCVIKRIVITGSKTEDKLTKTLNKPKNKKCEKQSNLVKFVKKGLLSPKHLTKDGDTAFKSINTNTNSLKTSQKEKLKAMVRKELTFDEVKSKITRSEKLNELKASINRIQELEKVRKIQEEKNKQLKTAKSLKESTDSGITLKEFKTIDLEVLTSPAKGFKTPVKQCPYPTPIKNELMSPKNTNAKRILFSPSKDGTPAEIIETPAYQKYLQLSKTSTLLLPFKYRNLVEIFKAIDSVSAMYFNRKECITFKKLKSAVQRMIRKNFNESHLAQIKSLYPEAYYFYQTKMRNYGSVSKQDYFQLVITPNIGLTKEKNISFIDEDNVLKSAQSNAMNPLILIQRYQKFQQILLEKVKDEHDQFLKSLDPPINITKDKVKRWHPEFDLENCPDIEEGNLPQPPNVEKFTSAKDMLFTARNLFNTNKVNNVVQNETSLIEPPEITETPQNDITSTLLKGVPKSLLEKIRAKQASKAHNAMLRRPSQDQEAIQYCRLPEMARHLRNVFITERKGVLPLEIVIKKIENSYKVSLSQKEIELHLKLIAKEYSEWIQFHEIRKTHYIKMQRDMELTKIITHLEKIANSKSN